MLQLKQAKQKVIALATTSALSALLLFPGVARSQVSISPLVIETAAKQGQSTGVIEVSNITNKPFRARVFAVPFTYNQENFQELKSSPQDLTPYLSFSPQELDIQPGQTRRIRLSSRFLPSTPAGEYRAVIYTESLEAISTNNNGLTIGIKPRVGVAVYVRHGDASPELKVESGSYNLQQRQIKLLVNNTGNATARPKLKWTLTQGGKQLETGDVEATTVVAGEKRYLVINYPTNNTSATAGEYQLGGELIWDDAKNTQKLPFNVNLKINPNEATKSNLVPQVKQ